MSQARFRLLLSAIDERLRADEPHEPPAEIDYKNLQVEHVIPRKWNKHSHLTGIHGIHGSVITEDSNGRASLPSEIA